VGDGLFVFVLNGWDGMILNFPSTGGILCPSDGLDAMSY